MNTVHHSMCIMYWKKNWLWSSSANTWISIAVSLSAAAQSPIYSAVKAAAATPASFWVLWKLEKPFCPARIFSLYNIYTCSTTHFLLSVKYLLFSIEKSLQLIQVLLKMSLNIEKYLPEEIKTGNGNRSSKKIKTMIEKISIARRNFSTVLVLALHLEWIYYCCVEPWIVFHHFIYHGCFFMEWKLLAVGQFH